MDIEVLLVEQDSNENYWNIIGIAGYSQQLLSSENKIIHASKNTIEIVRKELNNGNRILVPKNINHIEIIPSDLIIDNNLDQLTKTKNIALNNILNLITQNILTVNIIDAMDYLNCYMKLLAAGIYITDKNREDKYFEIIEAAQENEEPSPLAENATFEEEQKYIENKKKYDDAQENLNTLEKYLNAYDKLSKINFTNNFLNELKEKIIKAKDISEVEKIIKVNDKQIKDYFYIRDLSLNNY